MPDSQKNYIRTNDGQKFFVLADSEEENRSICANVTKIQRKDKTTEVRIHIQHFFREVQDSSSSSDSDTTDVDELPTIPKQKKSEKSIP